MAGLNRWRRRTREPEDPYPPLPRRMEGVPDNAWEILIGREYARRQALEQARSRIQAELARPREGALSHLTVSTVAVGVFGSIALAFVLMGFGWWALAPVGLLIPALYTGVHFGLKARRTPGEGSGTG